MRGHLPLEGVPVDLQQASGLGLVAPGGVEGALHGSALDLGDHLAEGADAAPLP